MPTRASWNYLPVSTAAVIWMFIAWVTTAAPAAISWTKPPFRGAGGLAPELHEQLTDEQASHQKLLAAICRDKPNADLLLHGMSDLRKNHRYREASNAELPAAVHRYYAALESLVSGKSGEGAIQRRLRAACDPVQSRAGTREPLIIVQWKEAAFALEAIGRENLRP